MMTQLQLRFPTEKLPMEMEMVPETVTILVIGLVLVIQSLW